MQSSAMAVATEIDEGLAAHVNPCYKFILFVGPSGVGKTSFVEALRQRDNRFRSLLSVTTRKPRDTDLEGEYQYVTLEQFEEWEAQDDFQWKVPKGQNGCRYGTLKCSVVEAKLAQFPTVFHLEPDTVPDLLKAVGVEVVCMIFLTAGSDQVKGRLRRRDDGMPEAHFEQREKTLVWEDDARKSGLPYRFVANPNGGLAEAVTQVVQIITEP